MKTKFSVSRIVFSEGPLDKCYEDYEKHYKKYGWQLSKEEEDVFMIIDRGINLNEGDRVSIDNLYIVVWKCLSVLDDIVEYSLEEE